MKNFLKAIGLLPVVIINQSFGAEEGMPQLNPEFWFSQVFWLIFFFLLLYIFIWKLVLPKITNNIENRKTIILNDLDEAKTLKEQAEKKFSEYEKIIENAKNEARKIIIEDKKKLELDIESKKKVFDKEIENELTIVQKQIMELKKSSINDVNKIAVEISQEIVKKIIGTELNKSNVSAIVDNISKKNLGKYL